MEDPTSLTVAEFFDRSGNPISIKPEPSEDDLRKARILGMTWKIEKMNLPPKKKK